jgi:hypothetical protein
VTVHMYFRIALLIEFFASVVDVKKTLFMEVISHYKGICNGNFVTFKELRDVPVFLVT